ncbi:radical SAM protein [Heliobacterium undosum]|uniref:Radical SAM protein n=2 Tax=Heliomicrobium undosum TaxID=121734 RepID=A0A845L8T6_9FIRM|nr:radical SAM protein [Heliomicrobium undosum]
MKYTLLVTQECNLRCPYCYIQKRPISMSLDVAQKIVDFMYTNTPPGEKMDIGFFGGEPLLAFERIQEITALIESHRSYRDYSIELSIVSNGTVFSDAIADFINRHNISFCISCDGPGDLHNMSRSFPNGEAASAIVEATIKQARKTLPVVLVNAVYGPQTFRALPRTVEYFRSLGLKRIFLNPDFSAPWTQADTDDIAAVYEQISAIYIDSYRKGRPLYISLIDGKIAIILRGGYQPEERCHMGRKEFAFTPDGYIFPCERLVGDGAADNRHCIGHVERGLQLDKLNCNVYPSEAINKSCITCGLRDYCMNWCGCSNYQSSGYYNRVGPFTCASEKAAITVALNAYQMLERQLGATFFEHLAGKPSMNAIGSR